MRLVNPRLEEFRRAHPHMGMSPPGTTYGYFVWGPLRIISSGSGEKTGEWEHVSVSRTDRCPTWDEMNQVKELFWADNETVLQFHPKRSEYKNQMPFCLHLWKQTGIDHELPPRQLV